MNTLPCLIVAVLFFNYSFAQNALEVNALASSTRHNNQYDFSENGLVDFELFNHVAVLTTIGDTHCVSINAKPECYPKQDSMLAALHFVDLQNGEKQHAFALKQNHKILKADMVKYNNTVFVAVQHSDHDFVGNTMKGWPPKRIYDNGVQTTIFQYDINGNMLDSFTIQGLRYLEFALVKDNLAFRLNYYFSVKINGQFYYSNIKSSKKKANNYLTYMVNLKNRKNDYSLFSLTNELSHEYVAPEEFGSNYMVGSNGLSADIFSIYDDHSSFDSDEEKGEDYLQFGNTKIHHDDFTQTLTTSYVLGIYNSISSETYGHIKFTTLNTVDFKDKLDDSLVQLVCFNDSIIFQESGRNPHQPYRPLYVADTLVTAHRHHRATVVSVKNDDVSIHYDDAIPGDVKHVGSDGETEYYYFQPGYWSDNELTDQIKAQGISSTSIGSLFAFKQGKWQWIMTAGNNDYQTTVRHMKKPVVHTSTDFIAMLPQRFSGTLGNAQAIYYTENTFSDPETENYTLYIPNAFSPDGDGINDYWSPRYEGIATCTFSIFDKSGTRLETALQYWDGSHKGKPAPEGAYFYVVEATTLDGQSLVRSGNITLLR